MPGAMSFAHLKNKDGRGNKKQEKTDRVVDEKIEIENKDDSADNVRANHTRSSLIMESKFCYGCEKFSVDSPGTKKETGWCQRDMVDESGNNYHEFRMIPSHAMAKQCPLVKSGDIIFL